MERLNFAGERGNSRQEVTSRARTVEIFGGKQRFGGSWNMANIDVLEFRVSGMEDSIDFRRGLRYIRSRINPETLVPVSLLTRIGSKSVEQAKSGQEKREKTKRSRETARNEIYAWDERLCISRHEEITRQVMRIHEIYESISIKRFVLVNVTSPRFFISLLSFPRI